MIKRVNKMATSRFKNASRTIIAMSVIIAIGPIFYSLIFVVFSFKKGQFIIVYHVFVIVY